MDEENWQRFKEFLIAQIIFQALFVTIAIIILNHFKLL